MTGESSLLSARKNRPRGAEGAQHHFSHQVRQGLYGYGPSAVHASSKLPVVRRGCLEGYRHRRGSPFHSQKRDFEPPYLL